MNVSGSVPFWLTCMVSAKTSEVYNEYFGDGKPAGTLKTLLLNAEVEIECFAVQGWI